MRMEEGRFEICSFTWWWAEAVVGCDGFHYAMRLYKDALKPGPHGLQEILLEALHWLPQAPYLQVNKKQVNK